MNIDSRIIGRLYSNQVLVEKRPSDEGQLSESRKRMLDELKQRDNHVRQHESSHANSPGVIQYGAPRFKYQLGPDGRPYAVGGEVTLGTMPSDNPQTARINADALRKAALANGDPSPQDLAAASSAEAMKIEADINMISRSANIYKNMETEMNRPVYPPVSSLNFYA
ncbi:MAG TPA: putative metalloprotease CJM1_0395 family protein [Spirochaetota bacterium]|mgnify:CR=1 FL=1|nr:putative metalloprotease CJM1_0395 family protein [Spirochaetota bacterium]